MSFFLNNGYLVSFIERRLGRHDGTRCYVRDIEMFFFLWCRFKILNFVHFSEFLDYLKISSRYLRREG